MQRTQFLIEKKDIKFVPPTWNSVAKKRIISRMTYLPKQGRTFPLSPSSSMPTLSFSFITKAHRVNRDIFGYSDCCLEPKYLDAVAVASKDHMSPMLDETAAIWLDLKERTPNVQREAQSAGILIRQPLGEIDQCA
jgi:hypothetical protein